MTTAQTICVDLDGTLVRNDLFQEGIIRLIKKNPLNLFRILYWLFNGRAFTKERIAEKTLPDARSLLFEKELVEYLIKRKQEGKKLILTTASHRRHAEIVADHLGIFDSVMATDATTNLKGANKLKAISARMAGKPFSYAGDAAADRPIWKAAAGNIFVNAPAADVKTARSAGKAELIINSKRPVWRAFIKEMRPHQYAKNALVFVPLITAHAYFNIANILQALLVFIVFSLCASGVYFLNDIMDMDADRRHATKRNRPIASGDISIPLGVAGAIILPLMAFLLAALTLPHAFLLVLGAYFLITNCYTFFLKQIHTADVMTLAVLYTTRVVAGGVGTGIALSFWLLIFSLFLFVSLAYLKRYIELAGLKEGSEKAPGRGYSSADKETVFALGIATMTASVLVLALYIQSDNVIATYDQPAILTALCLLMLYWGNRVWLAAKRNEIDDDPVVYAIKDKTSRFVLLGFIVVMTAAKYL